MRMQACLANQEAQDGAHPTLRPLRCLRCLDTSAALPQLIHS